jgi:hypothetical protein
LIGTAKTTLENGNNIKGTFNGYLEQNDVLD